jgi:deazaflavin-dependent oxidoreductase (nitroreductase family)
MKRRQSVAGFDTAVTKAVQTEREVELTTYGRKTGKPSRRILWAYGDDERIFIRSGQGLGRDWPQNLLANGRGTLHVGGFDVPVHAVHLTDIAAARRAGNLGRSKYGETFSTSADGEEPTLGEQATFELLPAEE